MSVEVVKSLSAVSFGVVVELRLGLFVSAVGSGFKNFRREGNFKNNFYSLYYLTFIGVRECFAFLWVVKV